MSGMDDLKAQREGESARSGTLRVLDVEMMISTPPPPVPWIVEPILARGCVTMLAGREGHGKSMVGLAVAAAIGRAVSLDDVAGMPVFPGGEHVLYVDAENGEAEAHRRIYGLNVAPGTLTYVEANGFDLKTQLCTLMVLIDSRHPSVVVLDSLRSLAPGMDENDSQRVEVVLRPLVQLAHDLEIAILILHHASRMSGEYRGSTAIGAAVELGFTLSRHEEDPMGATRRKLACWKSRPAPEPEERWLTIQPGFGGGIVIEEAAPYVPVRSTPVQDALETALREFAGGGGSGTDPIGGVPRVPPPWSTADFGRAVGRDHDDKTLRRAVQRLEEAGLIHRNGDGRWYPSDEEEES
jgi:hypothetical protein